MRVDWRARARPFRWSLLGLALLVAGGVAAQEGKKSSMAEIDLGIKDEAYWGNPEPSMDVFRELRDSGSTGHGVGKSASCPT